jgi:hypothetical protein
VPACFRWAAPEAPPEVLEAVSASQDQPLLHLHLLLHHPLLHPCHLLLLLLLLLLNQVPHQHLLILQGLRRYAVGSALPAVVQGWCWGHP